MHDVDPREWEVEHVPLIGAVLRNRRTGVRKAADSSHFLKVVADEGCEVERAGKGMAQDCSCAPCAARRTLEAGGLRHGAE